MPKVLIADDLSQAAVDIFTNRGIEADIKVGLSKDELIAIADQYDGLAVRSACKPDADVIAAATNLKVIGRAGIGVDNIDIKAATAKGVVVMNTPFGNAVTTAEHAIAMMFAAARQIPAADQGTQAGKWPKKSFVGTELSYKTLGLIGCGNIGARVAERAKGLIMKVVAYDPFLTEERAIELGVEKVDLDALLARADVITLHTPLTEQTRNILSKEALAKAKKGLILVNCARGGLVDETAVREMLDSGHLAAAAFDVFAEEPAKENVLFGAPNFIATPHLGAATVEAQENVALQVAEQMSDYLLSGAVTNALNMPSVTADEAPRLKPFIELAEKLGAFAGQVSDHGFEEVVIEYEGEVAELNRKPVTAAALSGLLHASRGDVNMVSAPSILAESGVKLSETKTEESPVYDNLIRIKVKVPRTANSDETGWRSLAGTVSAGRPRIVEVKGMPLEGAFSPVMLYVNNIDKPGFIGALGAMLGEAGINIATFHLGRQDTGGEAIALIGIDGQPPHELTEKLDALPHVRYAKVLNF
ncbi:phosphoglycerate dehydrogenase [Henriciella barbarensis]|uniref:D-3-phosphoglycerate dehydrogenase n=1 Tax=Henriciella barbarensis TaxID=86342 RepID=A0A399R4C5_9PROT|nr:phosphoglycerate dehydrogenase [Henriciella barbarensis]RIJ24279.1 phosphoglycerate dehydrogenase [Henriciella barbarensis]